MKSVLVTAILLFTGLAQAESSIVLTYHNVYNCNFWSYTNGGYVCSGYPQRVPLADAFSTNSNLEALDARIKALEAQVQALLKAQQNQ